jgi:GTP-binding protein
MSHRAATRIASMIKEYLVRREGLALLVMIVDARRGPNDDDLALARTSVDRGIGVVVAASKIDKLKRSQRDRAAHLFRAISAPVIPCSAVDGEGVETLRRAIADLSEAHGRLRVGVK